MLDIPSCQKKSFSRNTQATRPEKPFHIFRKNPADAEMPPCLQTKKQETPDLSSPKKFIGIFTQSKTPEIKNPLTRNSCLRKLFSLHTAAYSGIHNTTDC
ncbi:hypothetical protein [Kerstersia similis]|uniref:hypothetical protein n=1 Tax=Kerstersia similis TaxID=206505 RepID=UPI0039EF504F